MKNKHDYARMEEHHKRMEHIDQETREAGRMMGVGQSKSEKFVGSDMTPMGEDYRRDWNYKKGTNK